ncbi:MAG: hypothetical protein EOM73_16120, partial [Bacteroidia bacterium]|nr:hypothetical protein [Bacteroidia bacterium]
MISKFLFLSKIKLNMTSRRTILKSAILLPFLPSYLSLKGIKTNVAYNEPEESDFSKKLKPVGRILEEEGYYVWCNSPIYAPDGKVHVFH